MSKLYTRISDWEIGETQYSPDENLYFETIFTLGNGYMAARGMLDEGFFDSNSSIPGFYVAGIFDHYEDGLYELVSQPNIFNCRIFVEADEFSLRKGVVSNYSRILNLKQGILTRSFDWEFSGKKTHFEISRIISMDKLHLATAKYKIIPLNYDGNIKIISCLDKTVGNLDWGKKGTFELSASRHYHFDIMNEGFGGKNTFYLKTKTRTTALETAQAIEAYLHSVSPIAINSEEIKNDKEIGNALSFDAKRGVEYFFEKKVAVFSSRDPEIKDALESARSLLVSLTDEKFDDLRVRHIAAWEKKWETSDIKIEGNPLDQAAVRFNIFHLIQANAENDPFVSIGGRFLGSEVFNGGVFWDTEMFVLPFFIYTNPSAAKNLLLYRYNTLEKAREKAERHWLKGAMYPATSVYDGREQCAFWEYANVEIHFIADIAYAVCHYYEARKDDDFFIQEGLEILVETARFWASRFFYDKCDERYHLILVQGPDEYTGPVNNDTYTLIMAKLNLQKAIDAITMCQRKDFGKWKKLKKKLGFDETEQEKWSKIIEKAYDDYYDEAQKLYISDETFLRRVPINPFPIKVPHKMLRFTMPSYDTLLRHQIVKQPSIVLLMYLLPNMFSKEEKIANWNFYEPKTIHDSSLSFNTHAIMASELGLKEKAYDYFLKTAHLDLNKSRDTDLGLHSACIGGTWQAIVNGFAGMRLKNGNLNFSPSIPESWVSFSFKISFRNQDYHIKIDKDSIKIKSTGTLEKIDIMVYETPVTLISGKEQTFKCQ